MIVLRCINPCDDDELFYSYSLPQGCNHRGWRYGAPPIFRLASICQISVVLVNVVLLIKPKDSPICQQIGLDRSLFVEKLGLCTSPINFFSFTPTLPLSAEGREQSLPVPPMWQVLLQMNHAILLYTAHFKSQQVAAVFGFPRKRSAFHMLDFISELILT